MSGTTYSRTDGTDILTGTYEYVRARGDIDPKEILDPSLRYDYDKASPDGKKRFNELARKSDTAPPDYLKFAIASGIEPLTPYPGEDKEHNGYAPDGHLVNMPHEEALTKLGITTEELIDALSNFSGEVILLTVPPNTRIYRTIGLTAKVAIKHGDITNKLEGQYWSSQPPDAYESEAKWREKMAILKEWNGDYGYLEIKTDVEINALYGKVAMQHISRQGAGSVLPGGGQQYAIFPKDLRQLFSAVPNRTLSTLLKPTRFKENI